MIIAGAITVIGAVAALIGSYHLANICGVLLIPALVDAGVLRFAAKNPTHV